MPRKTVKNTAETVETAAPVTPKAKRERKPKAQPVAVEQPSPVEIVSQSVHAAAVHEIPCAEVRPGSNDRKHFDENELNNLAASIQQHGLAQPITVRPMVDPETEAVYFQIVAGERRFRAISQVLGWEKVPAIIRVLSDEEASAIMLVENTSRVDLDPIAEANAYSIRVDRFGWSVQQIAQAAGVSQERVKNRLTLLKLADDVQHFIKVGQFPQGHALLLVDLDKDRQRIGLKAYNTAKHMPLTRFADVVAKLRAAQEAESQISMFDLELLIVAEVESDTLTPLRGKGARTGAPVNLELPTIRVSPKDGVGDILDRYISTLMAAGQEDAAAAIGTIYTAMVAGNWVSVPANSQLAKTAESDVAAGDAVKVEKL